jgi:hypothetical protein
MNAKMKTTKLWEKKTREFHDIQFNHDFFNVTTKA